MKWFLLSGFLVVVGFATAVAVAQTNEPSEGTATFTVTYTIPTVTVTVTVPTEPPPPPPPPDPPPPPPPSPGCSSTLTPSDSINTALAFGSSGQTICLGAGTYSQAIVYARPLTAFLTLRCLTGAVLTNPSGHTLRVNQPGAFLRVEDCRFVNSGVTSGGVIDSYGSHIEILGGEVTGSRDNGIYTAEESDHNVFRGIEIHHNGAADVNQDHGIYLQGTDHLVEGNSIHDHPLGFGVQGYDNGNRNRILDNRIARSGHAGIVVGGGSSGDYRNVEVARNVISESTTWSIDNDRLDGACGNWPSGSLIHDNTLGNRPTDTFPAGCAVRNF